MSDHNPTSATADLSVLAHLRSGLVNAAGSAPSSPVFSLLSSFGLEHLYRETIGRISATQE
jgi:hypothetical protein